MKVVVKMEVVMVSVAQMCSVAIHDGGSDGIGSQDEGLKL